MGVIEILNDTAGVITKAGAPISIILFAIAGIVYAYGMMQPAEHRGKYQSWAMSVFIGAVIVAVMTASAPFLAGYFGQQGIIGAESLAKNIRHDLTFYGDRAEVRERRKAWARARRDGEKLVRTWVMVKGEWLPESLYNLRRAAEQKPRQYKRPSAALRWYQQQTEKIISLTKDVPSI